MRKLLFAISILCLGNVVRAVDISDPMQFVFVGDRVQDFIDVVSVTNPRQVFRIDTSIHPDHIVVTPFAPIAMYADVQKRMAVFYDLEKKREVTAIELPLTPRHVVLDTTGSKIGISDSVDGGFVLINAYAMQIDIAIPDFPATGPVLFDPNDIDIYFTNSDTGSIGLLDTNTKEILEAQLSEADGARLSAPSRSLDARYIYVTNHASGEVLSINAFSQVIFRSFDVGANPARPYTTPHGEFLYLMDVASGRFVSVDQHRFRTFAETVFDHSVDLVAVGRFDRFSLFLSTAEKGWSMFDNAERATVASGRFRGTPIAVWGSADGKTAYVAFGDHAAIATVDLESHEVDYVAATRNGASGFAVGISNNVCH